MSYISNIAINKIIENYKLSNIKGMIVASPSSSPPYQYHWVRDASIIMNVIIKHYLKTKNNNLFLMIINYIENSAQIQKLNTLTGLGEPKVNIDRTPFNDSWGRPQNDGPALRGINMIKIYKLLIDDKYINISNIVLSIITNDCDYILNNYNKICFDLWEEINGWHFYTRMVQLKFLIDCLNIDEDMLKINHKSINIVINKLIENLKDHIDKTNQCIISSFDKNGNIVKYDDASILLAFCHINFDKTILEHFKLELVIKNCENLIDYFRKKYNRKDINLIGRYINDSYYDGHLWIICSLALAQIFKRLNKGMISTQIFKFVISIDEDFNLSEQYDLSKNKQLSAKKLTWNYAELYNFIN